MGRYKTNVLVSLEPAFKDFRCCKAPLLIPERDAWKRRYEYHSPMVPLGNCLYFTDMTEDITIVNRKDIEVVSLRSTESLLLQKLIHSALRILFEDREFTRYKGTYIHSRFKYDFNYLGMTYTIFNGVAPIVSFQNGYGLIKMPSNSKIFVGTKTTVSGEWAVTLCDFCNKKPKCTNLKHKISRIESIDGNTISLKDIDGFEFACPSDMVRIEPRSDVLKGLYTSILTRTSLKTTQEFTLVSNIVEMLSSNGTVIIDFNKGNQVPFQLLEE